MAFGPALRAPFDFDDVDAVTNNVSIRRLWPPGDMLHPPGFGAPVSGRPVVNVSFGLNYAVNRALGIAQSPAAVAPNESIGYHVTNMLLHIAAALLLAAIIRRTIRFGRVPDEWRDSADRIAAIAAGIWLIHPLQTEAVDYVSQRTEVLASVFYLTALYAAIRAWQNDRLTAGATLFSVTAVVAALLGVGSKEILITLPIIVMLYDRAFLASDWTSPWRTASRRSLYLALLATSGVCLARVAAGARDTTAGFGGDVTWYQYLYSQAWAITHYVRLFFWPDALTFDYGLHVVTGLAGVPGAILLTAVFVATVAAWLKPQRQWLGFLGAWFFLLLAPSSSFVPIRTEIAAERRIYLALAAVIVLLVVAAESALRRIARSRKNRGAAAGPARTYVFIALGLLVCALTGASFRRSAMYDDLKVRWLDGIAATPANGRAYQNLASAELRADPKNIDAADNWLQQAMTIDSLYVPAWVLDAKLAANRGRLDEALLLLSHALKLHPLDADATEEVGKVLLLQKHPELAVPYLRQVAALRPNAQLLTTLGIAYLEIRRVDLAVAVLEVAARMDSAQLQARRLLGAALIEQDRGAEALPYLEQANRLEPNSGVVLGLLGIAYAQTGKQAAAEQSAHAAATADSANPVVLEFAGRAMQAIGKNREATDYFARATALKSVKAP